MEITVEGINCSDKRTKRDKLAVRATKAVYRRIDMIRKSQYKTLLEFAEEAKIPLSRFEKVFFKNRGASIPLVDVFRCALALNITLSELFAPIDEKFLKFYQAKKQKDEEAKKAKETKKAEGES